VLGSHCSAGRKVSLSRWSFSCRPRVDAIRPFGDGGAGIDRLCAAFGSPVALRCACSGSRRRRPGRTELIGGVAPAINGAIRVQQGPHNAVTIDGALAQYPSVEIIRDHVLPNGYFSSLIFTKAQESGGPLNLYEPGEKFSVAG
jgi:hypothetical protein